MEVRVNLPNAITKPVLPPEAEIDPKNRPPRQVGDYLGKDGRRWHMWGRLCDRLDEQQPISAVDLVYEGWVGLKQARQFLRTMIILRVLDACGRTYRSTPKGMQEYTVYRRAS